MKDFLRSRIPSRPGEVVNQEGVVIGSHDGLDAVTIGQRHGFHIRTPGGPWYASAKEEKKDRLIVVAGHDHPALYASKARVNGIHWIANPLEVDTRGVSVAVRYRQEATSVEILAATVSTCHVIFKKPVFALAPGQSAVFYKGQECLGGGIIN